MADLRQDFFALVERLYGSRTPEGVRAEWAEIRVHLQAIQETATDADRKAFEQVAEATKMAAEIAVAGLTRWDAMDKRERHQMVKFLSAAEESTDRMRYVYGHRN